MIGDETDLVLDGFIQKTTIAQSTQSCDGSNEDDFGRVGRDYFSSCTSQSTSDCTNIASNIFNHKYPPPPYSLQQVLTTFDESTNDWMTTKQGTSPNQFCPCSSSKWNPTGAHQDNYDAKYIDASFMHDMVFSVTKFKIQAMPYKHSNNENKGSEETDGIDLRVYDGTNFNQCQQTEGSTNLNQDFWKEYACASSLDGIGISLNQPWNSQNPKAMSLCGIQVFGTPKLPIANTAYYSNAADANWTPSQQITAMMGFKQSDQGSQGMRLYLQVKNQQIFAFKVRLQYKLVGDTAYSYSNQFIISNQPVITPPSQESCSQLVSVSTIIELDFTCQPSCQSELYYNLHQSVQGGVTILTWVFDEETEKFKLTEQINGSSITSYNTLEITAYFRGAYDNIWSTVFQASVYWNQDTPSNINIIGKNMAQSSKDVFEWTETLQIRQSDSGKYPLTKVINGVKACNEEYSFEYEGSTWLEDADIKIVYSTALQQTTLTLKFPKQVPTIYEFKLKQTNTDLNGNMTVVLSQLIRVEIFEDPLFQAPAVQSQYVFERDGSGNYELEFDVFNFSSSFDASDSGYHLYIRSYDEASQTYKFTWNVFTNEQKTPKIKFKIDEDKFNQRGFEKDSQFALSANLNTLFWENSTPFKIVFTDDLPPSFTQPVRDRFDLQFNDTGNWVIGIPEFTPDQASIIVEVKQLASFMTFDQSQRQITVSYPGKDQTGVHNLTVSIQDTLSLQASKVISINTSSPVISPSPPSFYSKTYAQANKNETINFDSFQVSGGCSVSYFVSESNTSLQDTGWTVLHEQSSTLIQIQVPLNQKMSKTLYIFARLTNYPHISSFSEPFTITIKSSPKFVDELKSPIIVDFTSQILFEYQIPQASNEVTLTLIGLDQSFMSFNETSNLINIRNTDTVQQGNRTLTIVLTDSEFQSSSFEVIFQILKPKVVSGTVIYQEEDVTEETSEEQTQSQTKEQLGAKFAAQLMSQFENELEEFRKKNNIQIQKDPIKPNVTMKDMSRNGKLKIKANQKIEYSRAFKDLIRKQRRLNGTSVPNNQTGLKTHDLINITLIKQPLPDNQKNLTYEMVYGLTNFTEEGFDIELNFSEPEFVSLQKEPDRAIVSLNFPQMIFSKENGLPLDEDTSVIIFNLPKQLANGMVQEVIEEQITNAVSTIGLVPIVGIILQVYLMLDSGYVFPFLLRVQYVTFFAYYIKHFNMTPLSEIFIETVAKIMLRSDLTVPGLIRLFGIEETVAQILKLSLDKFEASTGLMNQMWMIVIVSSVILIVYMLLMLMNRCCKDRFSFHFVTQMKLLLLWDSVVWNSMFQHKNNLNAAVQAYQSLDGEEQAWSAFNFIMYSLSIILHFVIIGGFLFRTSNRDLLEDKENRRKFESSTYFHVRLDDRHKLTKFDNIFQASRSLMFMAIPLIFHASESSGWKVFVTLEVFSIMTFSSYLIRRPHLRGHQWWIILNDCHLHLIQFHYVVYTDLVANPKTKYLVDVSYITNVMVYCFINIVYCVFVQVKMAKNNKDLLRRRDEYRLQQRLVKDTKELIKTKIGNAIQKQMKFKPNMDSIQIKLELPHQDDAWGTDDKPPVKDLKVKFVIPPVDEIWGRLDSERASTRQKPEETKLVIPPADEIWGRLDSEREIDQKPEETKLVIPPADEIWGRLDSDTSSHVSNRTPSNRGEEWNLQDVNPFSQDLQKRDNIVVIEEYDPQKFMSRQNNEKTWPRGIIKTQSRKITTVKPMQFN